MTRTLMRFGLVPLMSALTLALAGCSSNEIIEQPDPLPDIKETVELDRIWRTSVGDGHDDEFLHLSPVYNGNTIYAVSADGDIKSVDPDTGKTRWQNSLDDRIFAGPGADGQQLYVVTREAELIALANDGSGELWRVPLPTEAIAAPQSNGSLVAVQTIDGRLMAFNTKDGQGLWQYEAQVPVLSMRTTAAPLVGADIVIASFANGRMIALSAEAGQPVWQYQVGQPQGRTELERLVDIGGQPLVLESAVMVAGYQGKLALVDIRSGQEIWSRPASSFNGPAIGGGSIYLADANGDVIALRGSDRRELWVQDNLSWRQLTRPAVSGEFVVVGDYEGYLHVMSQDDGTLVGQEKVDSDGLRVPIQVLRNGDILVYSNGGRLATYRLLQDD